MNLLKGKHTGDKNSHFGTCWITKNGESKVIKKEELNVYILDDWIKGRKIKNIENIKLANQDRVWIHNGTEIKMIYKALLESYIDNGWQFGIKDIKKLTTHPEYKKICILCGSSLQNASHNKSCYCNECKEMKYQEIKNDLHKKCKICGSINCLNSFCKGRKVEILNTLVKYFGFKLETIGTSDVFTEFERVKNMLSSMYHQLHMSSSEICKQFNYQHVSNLHLVFKNLDIQYKSLSEAISENILYGRMPINLKMAYQHGWHTTYNDKHVYLRSSYEFEYASLLDNLKIDYEVESIRIKYYDNQLNKFRCAVPDFYLIDSNTIVEVKSVFTLDIQNMKDKVKAYKENGYNFKLILEHNEYDLDHIEIENKKIIKK